MRAYLVLPAIVVLGCSSSQSASPTDGGVDATEPAAVLPALGTATTTESQTIVVSHARLATPDPGAPSDPNVIAQWISQGYGATTLGAGEAIVKMGPTGSTTAVPPPGANAKMLVRFVHLPDTQLADDESPTRVCLFDGTGATSGAFRPQEGDECRILDAAVRTINAIHQTLPISFVLTGGDNADNAQKNEVKWFMQIMDGSPFVKCDSGDWNDPVPGPNNDGKDPFTAAGLAMPWKWVTGNHDVLVQGNFAVGDTQQQNAVGTTAPTFTRDYAVAGGPLSSGPVAADPERIPLLRADLMTLVSGDADGHGIGAAQVATGKAYYSFDAPGTPMRFVIIDTVAETGGDEGVVHQHDVDTVLKPMLDQAKTDGKWVVIASHHSTASMSDGSDNTGVKQADALTPQAWIDFIGSYDNILFSIVGHTHENRVRYVAPTSGHGFWEVMASALADYPHQFRLVEIWDDDNGFVRLRGIVTNYATDGDPVAAEGRALGVADYVSGWAKDGTGTVNDRNVELSIPKPGN